MEFSRQNFPQFPFWGHAFAPRFQNKALEGSLEENQSKIRRYQKSSFRKRRNLKILKQKMIVFGNILERFISQVTKNDKKYHPAIMVPIINPVFSP